MIMILILIMIVILIMIDLSHIVGDSDALLDVDGDAFLFVDVLANLVEMILIMTNGVSDDYTDDQDVVDDDSNGDVDVLANLVEMILIMTMMLVMIMLIMTMLVIEK